MLQVKKILVPRDFSPCSQLGLEMALDLAKRLEAEVHLLFVQVIYADAYGSMAAMQGLQKPEHPEDIHGAHPGLEDAQVPIKQVVARDVAAAPAIVAYAEENDIDLIVMGMHGRRGLRRALLGSVAEEVQRTAQCPVLTVHPHEGRTIEPVQQHRIVVPIDFSKHSRAALQLAKELAVVFDAHLQLIHVVEDQLHPAFYNTQIWTVRDLIPDIEERALEELNVFYDETPGPNGVADMHVRYGHAAHGIIAYIKEQNPLLVVMATHGLRGIEHFLLGSVAEKVMRNVETPFLTVKAFGRSLLATAVSAEDALSES